MHWIHFNEHCARRSNRGQIRYSQGVQAALSHTKLIINNLTTPTGPVATVADLKERAEAAMADASQYRLPWMFGVPEPWLAVSLDEANAALEGAGLRHMMYMTVMECEGPLLPPSRPLPEAVEIRRVDSRTLGFDALNLNCRSYGMPVAVTDDVLDADTSFSDPGRDF